MSDNRNFSALMKLLKVKYDQYIDKINKALDLEKYRKKELLKKAQNNKIANVAGSV